MLSAKWSCQNAGEDEAGEASSAAAVVAGVVAVLGSGESEVAVLVQSGRVERAGWCKGRGEYNVKQTKERLEIKLQILRPIKDSGLDNRNSVDNLLCPCSEV